MKNNIEYLYKILKYSFEEEYMQENNSKEIDPNLFDQTFKEIALPAFKNIYGIAE